VANVQQTPKKAKTFNDLFTVPPPPVTDSRSEDMTGEPTEIENGFEDAQRFSDWTDLHSELSLTPDF
jgi:hypothetical protein